MGCGPSRCLRLSHVRINVKVNTQPDVYLGALEERIHIKGTTPTDNPNDYLELLKELKYLFFQYLDERTELKDDQGRPVSARYRKAMDLKLYINFEREFALELYRRRDEKISRKELSFLFETYVQKTDINLRPHYLPTCRNNDNGIYIGQILIIPPANDTEIARSLRSSENWTEQLIEYEILLEEEFQTIANGEGISPDDYVLLLLLYNEALGELRNSSQRQEQQTIINNFRQKFDTKRSMIEQYRRNHHQREEKEIPDTHSYTEGVEKELKENEENIDIKTWIDRYSTKTERSHSQQLQDYIDRQMKLIKQMEEKRMNQLKLSEEEIEAEKASDISLDSFGNSGDETDTTEDQFRKNQIQIEKKMKNIHNNLKEAIMNDPSNKENIKKELEDIRKKLREMFVEVDEEQIKQLDTTAEENMEPDDGINGHIESTENYENKVEEELLRDEDVLVDHIKQLREVGKHDTEEFEKLKENLHNRLQNQSQIMIEMEEKRKELVGKTESHIVHRKLTEIRTKCLENMSKDITDDDQIKETLEKYRQDQSRLATEVSFLRQEKLKQLKQRHEEAREKTGKSDEDETEMSMLDISDSSFDFSSDFDEEFTIETNELLTAMNEIKVEDSDFIDKRRSMLEEHLEKLEEKFKRLDSKRNDLVTDIERKTNAEEEIVNSLNVEFVKAIEENIDTLDDEMAKQKLQEHRMCQIKFLEDLDSERIQRKNLLAQKLRTSKLEEKTRMPPVMETDENWEAIDQELQRNAEELMDFLTDDTDDVNEGNRKKEISDRLEEYVDQQKQIVMGFELEKKKILGQEANGQNMDLSSNLSEINGWLKRNLLNKPMTSEEDVKDKLAEYRNKQKKLLEDVDSKRLQQKKILQLKLKKLREEKELKNGETSAKNSDKSDVVDDIAKITEINAKLSEEDKEFVTKMQEHVSDKLKMNDLIKQKTKSIKNQILQKKNTRRIQKQEEKQKQERNDEEQREALANQHKKYSIDFNSCYKKVKDDGKRMSTVYSESKHKAIDQIKRKKSQRNKRNSIEITTETNHEQQVQYSNNHGTQRADFSEENISEKDTSLNRATFSESSEDITTETKRPEQTVEHENDESQKTDSDEGDTSKEDKTLNKSTLSLSADEITKQSKPDTQKMKISKEDISKEDTTLNKATRSILPEEDKPETKDEQHVQNSNDNEPQRIDLSQGDVSKEDRTEYKPTPSSSNEFGADES